MHLQALWTVKFINISKIISKRLYAFLLYTFDVFILEIYPFLYKFGHNSCYYNEA